MMSTMAYAFTATVKPVKYSLTGFHAKSTTPKQVLIALSGHMTHTADAPAVQFVNLGAQREVLTEEAVVLTATEAEVDEARDLGYFAGIKPAADAPPKHLPASSMLIINILERSDVKGAPGMDIRGRAWISLPVLAKQFKDADASQDKPLKIDVELFNPALEKGMDLGSISLEISEINMYWPFAKAGPYDLTTDTDHLKKMQACLDSVKERSVSVYSTQHMGMKIMPKVHFVNYALGMMDEPGAVYPLTINLERGLQVRHDDQEYFLNIFPTAAHMHGISLKRVHDELSYAFSPAGMKDPAASFEHTNELISTSLTAVANAIVYAADSTKRAKDGMEVSGEVPRDAMRSMPGYANPSDDCEGSGSLAARQVAPLLRAFPEGLDMSKASPTHQLSSMMAKYVRETYTTWDALYVVSAGSLEQSRKNVKNMSAHMFGKLIPSLWVGKALHAGTQFKPAYKEIQAEVFKLMTSKYAWQAHQKLLVLEGTGFAFGDQSATHIPGVKSRLRAASYLSQKGFMNEYKSVVYPLPSFMPNADRDSGFYFEAAEMFTNHFGGKVSHFEAMDLSQGDERYGVPFEMMVNQSQHVAIRPTFVWTDEEMHIATNVALSTPNTMRLHGPEVHLLSSGAPIGKAEFHTPAQLRMTSAVQTMERIHAQFPHPDAHAVRIMANNAKYDRFMTATDYKSHTEPVWRQEGDVATLRYFLRDYEVNAKLEDQLRGAQKVLGKYLLGVSMHRDCLEGSTPVYLTTVEIRADASHIH